MDCACCHAILRQVMQIQRPCMQAYGAKNYPMMGEVMQRAMVINLAVALPIVLCWTKMSPILIALGQSKEIAPLAAKYMLLSAPQLLFTIVTVAVEKFQTTQVELLARLALTALCHARFLSATDNMHTTIITIISCFQALKAATSVPAANIGCHSRCA